MSVQPLAQTLEISIHALHEEGDLELGVHNTRYRAFLSTPSARRATRQGWSGVHQTRHFYPRPPRGGRRDAAGVLPWDVRISIRTLCEEGDRS